MSSSVDKASVRGGSDTSSVREHADFLSEGLRSLWSSPPGSSSVEHYSHVDLFVPFLPGLLQRM